MIPPNTLETNFISLLHILIIYPGKYATIITQRSSSWKFEKLLTGLQKKVENQLDAEKGDGRDQVIVRFLGETINKIRPVDLLKAESSQRRTIG